MTQEPAQDELPDAVVDLGGSADRHQGDAGGLHAALRTAQHGRKWSTRVVGISALGGIAYLADFAIGANIGISYGTDERAVGHPHLRGRGDG